MDFESTRFPLNFSPYYPWIPIPSHPTLNYFPPPPFPPSPACVAKLILGLRLPFVVVGLHVDLSTSLLGFGLAGTSMGLVHALTITKFICAYELSCCV